jgi:hypothetical protein
MIAVRMLLKSWAMPLQAAQRTQVSASAESFLKLDFIGYLLPDANICSVR